MTHVLKLQRMRCTWCMMRQMHVTANLARRKPPPERDMSKRNLQGEELAERLKRREMDIERQRPYKEALAAVISRFTSELDHIEREKHDTQGEMMKREQAEREEAVRNLAVIAKSNEELCKQREIEDLIKQDEQERAEVERQMNILQMKEDLHMKNKELILKTIEESVDFVTAENLEEKINEVVDNEISFNYAITPDGEKIHSTKPPGNLDGWRGASPSAYIMGGIKPNSTEWNFIFRNKETGYEVKKK